MLTEKLDRLSLTAESKKKILTYQKLYSVAFRKMFSNMELMEDATFSKDIIKNYVYTVKAYEYLRKEVEAKYETEQSNKKDTQSEMDALRKDMAEEWEKDEIDLRTVKTIQRKTSRKLSSLNKGITFGTKDLLATITKQSQNLRKIDPIAEREKYEKKSAGKKRNPDRGGQEKIDGETG